MVESSLGHARREKRKLIKPSDIGERRDSTQESNWDCSQGLNDSLHNLRDFAAS